jgi:hypothetical protein
MLQKIGAKLFFRILPFTFTVVLFLLLRPPEGGCCEAAGDDGGGGASTSIAAVSSAHTTMMMPSYSGNHEEDRVAQVCRESARNPRCINRSNLLQVFGWEIGFNLLLRKFSFI